MFYLFLNCTRLPLSRIFLVSLLHRVGPAQANARRPKRSKFTFGTSTSNPPTERSDRRGACWSSSAARYSGVPSYKALCTSTSSLYSIRFLTGSQCHRAVGREAIKDCFHHLTVALHLSLCCESGVQESIFIFLSFRFLLMVSLNQRRGRPLFL